jgi:hypothetical protein
MVFAKLNCIHKTINLTGLYQKHTYSETEDKYQENCKQTSRTASAQNATKQSKTSIKQDVL